ncbi:hypothetical protein DFO70_102172 [Cytobacillus firmus]|uniref:Probable membrane transporter protein n=2 Tax=Cytobacillus TaxID=2675230 RepID=A0A366K3J5_CYTFI|nr:MULTISPECIES: sulfite exporter TauE/SafE family protein [Cytobacillus]RBP95847.1 hypothetical protein DFO70_102172 [Cytobacillus firmus]TDX44760.1 hypothetical protein DFO72_103172 [Cytobacillus oceanisediminis]
MTGLLLLLIGIIAGGYGTIVGAGGGFIFVPALLLILDMNPVLAAGAGLVIVLINSLSGVIGYSRQGLIQYRTGLTIGISAIPGSLLGVWLLQSYSSQYFYVVFATMLVTLGIFLITKNSPFEGKAKNQLAAAEKYPCASCESVEPDTTELVTHKGEMIPLKKGHASINTRLILLGFIIGVLSSYLGIGGGWLLVPILIYIFKLPAHHATATSIFSLCIYSSGGVASQLFYNSFDWLTILFGGIGVIIGSQLGIILAQRMNGKVIMQMLSILLVIIGVRMFFS